ncbi:uncharacterized protein JCM10292_001652 [Rhodotorula paludigena]|uniref:uncharacterized protein n=1 Tax=Rhodotorula paludigena TaxID=86838 RepID=UPI00317DEDF3
MGKLVWHDWARLLALAAGAYVAWAAVWACAYRKFFWDFVGGTLSPKGLIPPPAADFFVKVIVDAPILPVINLLNGLFTLAFEWPLPFFVGSKTHNSLVFRVVLHSWCFLAAVPVYQTAFPSLFYLITTLAYLRSLSLGESLKESDKPAGQPGRV